MKINRRLYLKPTKKQRAWLRKRGYTWVPFDKEQKVELTTPIGKIVEIS